jgi:hypothetical protein
MFKKIALMGTVISASAAGIAFVVARTRLHRWGVDPIEATQALPGDELVTEPTTIDTRGIDIAAPPEQVWPWLVQMGYKRAGWYSYDAIDMNHGSSREIVPEFQSIEVGQVLPTHDDGGFVVKVAEAGKALVLYLDSTIVRDQADVAAEKAATEPKANIQATGRFLNSAIPGGFAASWAFVLEPTASGGTRLIERFRVTMEASTLPASVLGPVLGFGVFAMTRRQMLGIRDRASAAFEAGSVRLRLEPAAA